VPVVNADRPRAHRDTAFLAAKLARVEEPHVAPLNALVRELRAGGRSAPWVDPASGGVRSRILFLYESPGPRSSEAYGSNVISPDNDDPSAERAWRLARAAGLERELCVNWNAVPWYVSGTARNANATPADFREAEPWLHRFVSLLPDLRVVVVMGNFAAEGWLRYQRRDDAPVLPLIVSPHTSNQSRQSRPGFEAEIAAAMRKALLAATA
jgi:uracil-DNA glycosylase